MRKKLIKKVNIRLICCFVIKLISYPMNNVVINIFLNIILAKWNTDQLVLIKVSLLKVFTNCKEKKCVDILLNDNVMIRGQN